MTAVEKEGMKLYDRLAQMGSHQAKALALQVELEELLKHGSLSMSLEVRSLEVMSLEVRSRLKTLPKDFA